MLRVMNREARREGPSKSLALSWKRILALPAAGPRWSPRAPRGAGAPARQPGHARLGAVPIPALGRAGGRSRTSRRARDAGCGVEARVCSARGPGWHRDGPKLLVSPGTGGRGGHPLRLQQGLPVVRCEGLTRPRPQAPASSDVGARSTGPFEPPGVHTWDPQGLTQAL